MNLLLDFKTKPFIEALKSFFKNLNVPFNVISDLQTEPINIIGDKKCNEIISAIYPFGIVNDDVFKGKETTITQAELNDDKYVGILLFGVELTKNNPTRSDLAEITRQINRAYSQIPVVVVFRYADKITFANAERLNYLRKDKEGDKIGQKVAMLKDIEIEKPHRAHQDILKELGIHKAINFDELYQYWQKILNTKKLNDDFYKELFKWYLFAKNNVSFPNDNNEEVDKYLSESLIRFISRMLFVWFMKEKSLISNQLFETNELKNILKNFDEKSDKNIYYKAILQNLFFATLNVPAKNDERKWISSKKANKAQEGDPLIYRYENEFIDSNQTIESIFMKIPFLNGGLFDCLDDRENTIFIDGFTKNEKKQPQFQNYLFFGEHKNIDLSHHFADDAKEKKKWQNQNISGIIDLLNDYKFTIEENTPLEIDVALDPELLGKVFENLLASFNPETKATARKQTGSFYTPREIVNYMVDESLLTYLNRFQPLTGFETLSELTMEEKRLLVQKLFDCKILDPACGSGAYPMGVLHKMVELMTILDDKNVFLKEIEGKKLDNLIAGAKTLSDTNTRTQTVEALQKQKEILQNAAYDYVRKLYIIENCIYGVDIQPIAIQISKLRFFISLLVEQNKKEDQPNFGIEPLPNMDFKLVAANTLIAPPQEDKGTGLFADQDPFFETFENLAHDYFTLHTPESKKAKKQEIIALINEKVAEKQLQIKRQADIGKKATNIEESVKLWESYQNLFKEKAVGFFETKYFFPKVKDGFDVVIVNPPYVQCPKGIYSKELFPYSEGKDKGKQNLYKVFVENSYNLLKLDGVATMIVQSSLMCDISSQYTRELLLTKTKINHIIEFPKKAKTKEGQVFENVLQGTCVYNFVKKLPDDKTTFNVSIDNDATTIKSLEFEKLNQFDLINIYPNGYFVPLVNFGNYKLIEKISKSSIFLKEIIDTISQGDLNLTGDKDNFNTIKSDVLLLRGKHTHKYNVYYDSDEYIIGKFKENISNEYLNSSFFVCQQITGTTDKYRIHIALTEKKKVLFGNSVNKFSLKNSKLNKTILGILNSKLIDWYFRKTSTNNHVNGYEIEQLPIKIPENQLPFITLVNEILEGKKTAQDTSVLEHQIDVMVYHLYELSYEEACVIDAALSKEDFERYKM